MSDRMQVITRGLADPAQRPTALKELRRWEERPAGTIPTAVFANWHSLFGNTDSAFVWLDRAIAERDPVVLWVRILPGFERVRSDPRFSAFLAKLGQRP
jgi:hypothetical protein